MACGQKPEGRAYWLEYGFCDVPVHGPGKAKGLVIWSYGVDGTKEAFRSSTPPIMRALATAGWDVVRVNRNNLYETCFTATGNMMNCWSGGGVKHTADLVERGRQARAAGYDKVVAAGHSFGGAIALEAGAKAAGTFHGIIALSPGHGSDAGNGTSSHGTYYSLDKQILDALSVQHARRLIIAFPPGDAIHPNRYSDPIGPKVHTALVGTGLPFVQFDESLPITSHFAPLSNQFSVWFGGCIADFLEPASTPVAGQTICPAPSPIPRFLLPAGISIPQPGTAGTGRWLGAWEGADTDQREVAIIVEKIEGTKATVLYAFGAGPKRDQSMSWGRRSGAHLNGDRLRIDRGRDRVFELTLSADGQHVDVAYRSRKGTDAFTLSRPSGGKL